MRYDELADRVLGGGAVTRSEALEMLRARGAIAIEEQYGPYDAPSRHNPCGPSFSKSYVFGTREICVPWGFAVVKYTK